MRPRPRSRRGAVGAALFAYALLLPLLPSRLRRAAAAEMRATCRDALEAALRERGLRGLAARWAFEAGDLLLLAVREREPSLAGAATLALPLVALLLAPALPPLGREVARPADAVVVSARDPAGEFSLTLRGGRVVAGSLDRVRLPPRRLVQAGDSVRFLAEDGSPLFSVEVQGPGSIRWTARAAAVRS